MPVNYKELLEALGELADNHNIRVTVKSSLKGSAIAAGTTLLGGLVGGRYGVAVGALLGGTIGYLMSGDFKSVAAVIREDMNDEQRQKLGQHIIAAFKEFTSKDLISLAALIEALKSKDQSFPNVAVDEMKKFLVDQMNRTIVN